MSIAPTATPFSGTQSGSFISTGRGAGTFARTVSDQNGSRVEDTAFTLANGKTVTRDVTFTPTASGFSRTVATTLADGRTTTLQETGTRQADGSYAVAGTFTDQNGQTQTISGVQGRQDGHRTSALTAVNAAGQTRTLDSSSYAAGSQVLGTFSGTSFAGAAFSGSNALAILQSQPGGSA